MSDIEQKEEAPLEASPEVAEEQAVEVDASTEEPTEPKKKEYTTEQKLARTERMRAKYLKELGIEDPKPEKAEAKATSKPGDFDETQLDYLDLKGISDDSDIEVIRNIVKKTGLTVRQALKDEYVVAKLAANKAQRDTQAATPSSTKRAGSQGINLEALVAKAERTGELPDDFDMRSKVLNAIAERSNPNKPAWHR